MRCKPLLCSKVQPMPACLWAITESKLITAMVRMEIQDTTVQLCRSCSSSASVPSKCKPGKPRPCATKVILACKIIWV